MLPNDSLQKKRFQTLGRASEISVLSNFNFSMKSMLLSGKSYHNPSTRNIEFVACTTASA